MIDKQKLIDWIYGQIDNPRLTKDMAIILGVLAGQIVMGVFDAESPTYTTGRNENETVASEEEYRATWKVEAKSLEDLLAGRFAIVGDWDEINRR